MNSIRLADGDNKECDGDDVSLTNVCLCYYCVTLGCYWHDIVYGVTNLICVCVSLQLCVSRDVTWPMLPALFQENARELKQMQTCF